jgi:hypothetical protein
MLTIRDTQLEQMANSSPNTPMITPCADTAAWIEFRLIDENSNPIGGEPYRVRLPDQSIMTGILDSEGRVRFEGITPGQASICFPDIDGKEWRPL